MSYQERYKKYIETISKVLEKDIEKWITENKLLKIKLSNNEDIITFESVNKDYKMIKLHYNTSLIILKFDAEKKLLCPLSWQLGDLFEKIEDEKGNIDEDNLFWIVEETDRIFALLSKNKYNVIKAL